MATRQHVDAEGPAHQGRPAPGARTALHPCAVRTCGPRRRRGRGLGHAPSIDDHSRAPACARGQHAMANKQVCVGPRRHRRQPFQELQRLEHQLPRAVVPRRPQLERDAAVAPQPQALLREGRAQHVPGQALQPRPIVRRHPHVGMQVEPFQVRLPRPARRHGRRVARIAEPPHPRPRARAQHHPALHRGPDDTDRTKPRRTRACGPLLSDWKT